MAAIVLCEPRHLYNLLNQRVTVSRLAEINYLCLIDAREAQDYNVSHIITAKHGKTNSKRGFHPLENVEIDTMQNIVVYDSKTYCLDNPGTLHRGIPSKNSALLGIPSSAYQCAKMVAKSSLCIVQIVRGGFERFSALYPFLRTEKITYTIKELENLRTYPVEIILGKLYMGNEKQANCRTSMEHLNIKAVVCLSAHHISVWNKDVLKLEVGTEADKEDFCFEEICTFIDSQISDGSRVLLVSRHGSRRCSVAATAYVMLQHKYCFQEAWSYVKRCKPSVIFDKSFAEQLSDWEKKVSDKPSIEAKMHGI